MNFLLCAKLNNLIIRCITAPRPSMDSVLISSAKVWLRNKCHCSPAFLTPDLPGTGVKRQCLLLWTHLKKCLLVLWCIVTFPITIVCLSCPLIWFLCCFCAHQALILIGCLIFVLVYPWGGLKGSLAMRGCTLLVASQIELKYYVSSWRHRSLAAIMFLHLR
jgi:hypothetical protein